MFDLFRLLPFLVLAACPEEAPPPLPPPPAAVAPAAVAAAPVEAFAIKTVVPGAAKKGQAIRIAIVGTGFSADAAVAVGGKPATEVDVTGTNAITALTPADLDVGPQDVSVTKADGASQTLAAAFVVEPDEQADQAALDAVRAELLLNAGGIRKSEEMYATVFGGYVGHATPAPRALDKLSPEPVDWKVGTGFDTLGWSPEGKVAGSYWVVVPADGKGFEVHAAADADGDGTRAEVIATKDEDAKLVTPADVY